MIRAKSIIQDSPPGTPYGFRKCCEAVRDAVPIEDRTPLHEAGAVRRQRLVHGPLSLYRIMKTRRHPSTSTRQAATIATVVVEAATWWTLSSTAATTASSGRR